jgi:transglutaminase-like putative cysteine protease
VFYDLKLGVSQTYDPPAGGARLALRLLPADLPDQQRLGSAVLDIQPPPDERSERLDFFGNRVVYVAVDAPCEAIEFTLRARIDRAPADERLPLSVRLADMPAEVVAIRSLAPEAPHHFLGGSRRVWPTAATTAWALERVNASMPVIDVLETLGEALHADFRFDAEATTVETSFEEAFEHRHGVCQDFSHILIACLRGIGVPAGYVSGCLRTTPPPGQPRLEGADAMHAWVRAWCGPAQGWVEYDPTNACFVAGDHVLLARGRDYSDVAPVTGAVRVAGRQSGWHSVDLVPVG